MVARVDLMPHQWAQPSPGGTVGRRLSVENAEVLLAGGHGVDDPFGAVVLDQRDELEESGVLIEAQRELPLRVLLVQVCDVGAVLGGVDRILGTYAVLESGRADPYVVVQSRTARRMTSDRFRCSRLARCMSAAISSSVNRTGTTWAGAAPRAGRPRLRSSSTS